LIHHFNKNFPTAYNHAKTELCRLSSDNAEVSIDVQQMLPISDLSFIYDGAVDIGYDNAITTNHYELMDYSYSMDKQESEQEDPPFLLLHNFTTCLLLDKDSEITDGEDCSIASDSDGAFTPTFASVPPGDSLSDKGFSNMAVYTLFTNSFFSHNEMLATLNPLAEANLQPAEESLLALVIENCLPINVYNKILADWAQYARFTDYNFSVAPIYGTVLHRMQDKYAQQSAPPSPPTSEIVVVDGHQPMHVYRFCFLQQGARLFSNDNLMDGSLWDYHPQVDPVTGEQVYAEINTGNFWKLGTEYVLRHTEISDTDKNSPHFLSCPSFD
jgi:hypothetical protein